LAHGGRHAAGAVRGQERGHVGDLGQVGGAAQHGHAGDHALDGLGVGGALAAHLVQPFLGEGLDHPGRVDAEDTHAVRADLGGPVAHERLGGRVGRPGAAHPGHRPGARGAVEVEDDPRPLPGQPARRRPCGQEGRGEPGDHGSQEVVGRHVDKWSSLHVATRDEVEGHVDTAGLGGHGLHVRVHGALVGGVEDATSADPPAALMSAATASSGGPVRPARNTAAPSRAKVRATPPPIPPPAP
jgi:hypothetical protein